MKYAQHTEVAPEKSKAEIEACVRKYGADQFASGWANNRAVVQFRLRDRFVKFALDLPSGDEPRFQIRTVRGHREKRAPEKIPDLVEQEIRQRWRALALTVKAKLEAVETGISTFESEFLAFIVLPNGETVGQWIAPQVDEAYRTGNMPKLLPGLGETFEASE